MSLPSGEGFPKAMRVRRRREYLAAARVGERRHSEHFTVICVPVPDRTRLGITVTRKVGGAVQRNVIKRRVREVFRRDPSRLAPGYDLIVIAKQGAARVPLHDVARELTSAVGSLARRLRPPA